LSPESPLQVKVDSERGEVSVPAPMHYHDEDGGSGGGDATGGVDAVNGAATEGAQDEAATAAQRRRLRGQQKVKMETVFISLQPF
jgi:hypothetical protein